jgi:hypothetical protein
VGDSSAQGSSDSSTDEPATASHPIGAARQQATAGAEDLPHLLYPEPTELCLSYIIDSVVRCCR